MEPPKDQDGPLFSTASSAELYSCESKLFPDGAIATIDLCGNLLNGKAALIEHHHLAYLVLGK